MNICQLFNDPISVYFCIFFICYYEDITFVKKTFTQLQGQRHKSLMLFGVFLFFNMLKNKPFCIDGTYFLFLLSCISQIFITKYVFCCHQENSIILSGLKIIHLGKISLIPPVSHLRHRPGHVCKRSLKFLCNTEAQVDGLLSVDITMCWVSCMEQIPQKTLPLPTDTSYDAGLGAWQQAECTLQPNYGVLRSYWKTMSYVHT